MLENKSDMQHERDEAVQSRAEQSKAKQNKVKPAITIMLMTVTNNGIDDDDVQKPTK